MNDCSNNEDEMRILLADDHELVRDTLAAFLTREPGFEVSTCADFPSVVKALAPPAAFDIILLDYNMPGMFGLEGVKQAIELARGKPVALISGTANRSVAEEALNLGAMGFLPKTMAARSLVNAVRFMATGEKYAPVGFMTEKEEETEHPFVAKLTPREREVLSGLMQGLSNKEIALKVDLQEVTVKLHVKTLCRKTGARNRTHAAMLAKQAGLQ